MKKQYIVLAISGCISIICLSAAYLKNDSWLFLPVLLLMATIWLVGFRYSLFWSSTSMLAGYVILAGIGIQAGFSTPLMMVGCAAALASWELINFIGSLADSSQHDKNDGLENRHLSSLGLAVFVGIGASLAATYIQVQPAFGMIAGLALLTVGSFVFAVHHLLNN